MGSLMRATIFMRAVHGEGKTGFCETAQALINWKELDVLINWKELDVLINRKDVETNSLLCSKQELNLGHWIYFLAR